METMVICSPKLTEYEICKYSTDFLLCEHKISFALIKEEPHKYLSIKLPDEYVLVYIKAFSCNYRDKSLALAFNRSCKEKESLGSLSYSPFGSEFVGEIIRMGNKVLYFNLGDRVIPDGAYPKKVNGMFGGLPTNYASQRLHLFHWAELIKIPDQMPDDIAAGFTIAAQTSFSMIRKLDLKPLDKILVTAPTSNTSLAIIAALSSLNVEIYACSYSNKNNDRLKKLGVKEILRKNDFLNNNTPSFNAVIDPFFDLYFSPVIEHITNGGKYITCGRYMQHSSMQKADIMNNKHLFSIIGHCLNNNISIIGNCLGTRKDLENAIKSYQIGEFNIVIDSIYTNEEIIPFISKTFHSSPRFGKVIYKYGE